MEKRIKFIDIARGVAICIIVLGHTMVYSKNCVEIFKFLYSFNVALFFILSGYLFNIKNESFFDFIKRKFLRICIPYLFWELVFIIPYMIFGKSVNDSLGTNRKIRFKNTNNKYIIWKWI